MNVNQPYYIHVYDVVSQADILLYNILSISHPPSLKFFDSLRDYNNYNVHYK